VLSRITGRLALTFVLPALLAFSGCQGQPAQPEPILSAPEAAESAAESATVGAMVSTANGVAETVAESGQEATLPAPALRVTSQNPVALEQSPTPLSPAGEATPSGLIEDIAASTPAPDQPAGAETSGSFQICSPLVGEKLEDLWLITSDPYRPPPPGDDGRHEGVDFSYYRRGERESILGAGVQAVLPGWAAASLGDTFPYGNFLILETPAHRLPEGLAQAVGLEPGESLYTVYAHLLHRPRVPVGEWVEACQYLGEVGNTGNANVAHLHLEMRTGPAGALFLHMSFYRPDDTEVERENYLRWRISGEYLHFDPLLVLNWSVP